MWYIQGFKVEYKMKTSILIRFICIALLWLLLCYLMLKAKGLDFYTLFVLIASGIIIFVPLYKKYIKGGNGEKKK